MSHAGHLVRRFWTSLSRRPVDASDEAWVTAALTGPEADLWKSMPITDQRHSIEVARRFLVVRPDAAPAEVAGALLHDAGKVESGLGTFGRVVATVVGPRTARFHRYHDHEALGAALAAQAGSHQATVELIVGRGPAADDLRAADDSI